MTTFDLSTFVDRLAGPAGLKLSLALVHFLWQGVLIAAGAAVLMRVLGRRSPQRRYAIGVAGMAAANRGASPQPPAPRHRRRPRAAATTRRNCARGRVHASSSPSRGDLGRAGRFHSRRGCPCAGDNSFTNGRIPH